MELFIKAFQWFVQPEQWAGEYGIPLRVLQHLWYTFCAVLVASAIAMPLGMFIGHTGKARWIITLLSAVRALPTLGVLTFLVLILGNGFIPPLVVLVLLAIPSILSGTYAGFESIGREIIDASKAMGMTSPQIITKVELPLALPVLMGGLRSAVLQVIATATVAAYINLGGLGRFLIDGLALGDYSRMLGGSIIIAVLAIVIDGVLALVQRQLLKEPTAPQSTQDTTPQPSMATQNK